MPLRPLLQASSVEQSPSALRAVRDVDLATPQMALPSPLSFPSFLPFLLQESATCLTCLFLDESGSDPPVIARPRLAAPVGCLPTHHVPVVLLTTRPRHQGEPCRYRPPSSRESVQFHQLPPAPQLLRDPTPGAFLPLPGQDTPLLHDSERSPSRVSLPHWPGVSETQRSGNQDAQAPVDQRQWLACLKTFLSLSCHYHQGR